MSDTIKRKQLGESSTQKQAKQNQVVYVVTSLLSPCSEDLCVDDIQNKVFEDEDKARNYIRSQAESLYYDTVCSNVYDEYEWVDENQGYESDKCREWTPDIKPRGHFL